MLGLFDILTEYATTLAQESFERDERETAQPLIFCVNFYAQFFANIGGFQITSIDNDARLASVAALRRVKKKGASTEVVRLFTWFEKLCDIYPDVVRAGYGEDIDDGLWENFHSGYLLTLLTRIVAWAEAAKLPDVEQRAKQALSACEQAVARLRA
jgi:hypothetical protein